VTNGIFEKKIGYPAPVDGLPYRPCVGIIVFNEIGKVWIGHRDDGSGTSDYDYAWQMPQGGIDKGEDPIAAAKRELYEETSIRSVELIEAAKGWFTYDYPPEILKDTRKGKYCGQAQKWVAFRFVGDESEIDVLSPPDGHSAEFSEWRWETASRLPDLIVPFKRQVYLDVVAAFAHLSA